MNLPTYFNDFIKRIRLSPEELKALRAAHTKLTENIEKDDELKDLIIGTFLQGSYKRSTIIKPAQGKKSDVDVVVVTKIGPDVMPRKALDHFIPFVRKHYKENFEPQSRSIGIVEGDVELDLVITTAPSEAEEGLIKSATFQFQESIDEVRLRRLMRGDGIDIIYNELDEALGEWEEEPLHIPDRDLNQWHPTHPIAQIKWTVRKNQRCNSHYVSVVKAIKWWHRIQKDMPKYPKGYPLEHMIGQCCDDGIKTISEGIVSTLGNILLNYSGHITRGQVPILKDHGVDNNVLKRITFQEFALFYKKVQEAYAIAKSAYDSQDTEESIRLWKKLFGEEFDPTPENDNGKSGGGFVSPITSSSPKGGRFG